jgi:hypothetical protein
MKTITCDICGEPAKETPNILVTDPAYEEYYFCIRTIGISSYHRTECGLPGKPADVCYNCIMKHIEAPQDD